MIATALGGGTKCTLGSPRRVAAAVRLTCTQGGARGSNMDSSAPFESSATCGVGDGWGYEGQSAMKIGVGGTAQNGQLC